MKSLRKRRVNLVWEFGLDSAEIRNHSWQVGLVDVEPKSQFIAVANPVLNRASNRNSTTLVPNAFYLHLPFDCIEVSPAAEGLVQRFELPSKSRKVTGHQCRINRRPECARVNGNCRGHPIVAFVGATVDLNEQVIAGVFSEFE